MDWTFSTRDFIYVLATLAASIVWFEARIRAASERAGQARELFIEKINEVQQKAKTDLALAMKERERAVEQVKAEMEKRIAQESAHRAQVEREIAEHKLAIAREFRDYPTGDALEKAIEQAVGPLRDQVSGLRSDLQKLFETAFDLSRMRRDHG